MLESGNKQSCILNSIPVNTLLQCICEYNIRKYFSIVLITKQFYCQCKFKLRLPESLLNYNDKIVVHV